MVDVYLELKQIPHLSVHDELIFSIDNAEIAFEIQRVMQNTFKGLTDIPIRTKPEVGVNWHSVKEIKNDQI
jgi:DNA polymerase I-like protein with 3'-5' exonuclease and polymerase domains